jgi:hypothetical protein
MAISERTTNPELAVNPPGQMSTQSREAVAQYEGAVAQHEANLADLFERHQIVHVQAEDSTLGQIEVTGREMQAELEAARAELVGLLWRRRALQADLAEDYRATVQSATEGVEKARSTEAARLEKLGCTLEAMPAGDSRAGRLQLAAKIDDAPTVIAAKHRVRLAEQGRLAAESGARTVPSWKATAFQWPGSTSRFAAAIRSAGRFSDLGEPVPSDLPGYSSIAKELGFAQTILPREDQDRLDGIVRKIGSTGRANPIFERITSGCGLTLEAVKSLPATETIRGILERSKQRIHCTI